MTTGDRIAHLSIMALAVALAAGPSAGAYRQGFDEAIDDWTGGTQQQTVRLGRRGGAYKAGKAKSAWKQLYAGMKWQKKLYTVTPKTYLTFAYYVTKSTNLRVALECTGWKAPRAEIGIDSMTPGTWVYAIHYLGVGTAKQPGAGITKNVVITQVEFYAGREKKIPGLEFYIDDVRISEGLPSDVLQQYRKQQRKLKSETYTSAKDGFNLDRSILLRLGERASGKETKSHSILAIGGVLATDEQFLSPLARQPGGLAPSRGYRIERAGAGSLEEMTTAAVGQIKSTRPELTVIWAGWAEAVAAIDARKAHQEEVSEGKADAAKAPTDDKARKRAGKALDTIVAAALKAGSIPVIMSVPPVGKIRRAQFVPEREIIGMNALVASVARKHEVPIINTVGVVMNGSSKGARRTRAKAKPGAHAKFPWLRPDTRGLSPAAYKQINATFLKLYKALEKNLLSNARKRQ